MPTNFQIEYSPTESTICPYCHSQLSQQETAMRCAECDSVYHVSCWAELDKCGLFGCEETVAHAVTYRSISGDGSQSRWLAAPDDIASMESVPDSLSQQTDYTLDLMIGMIILFGPAAYIDIFTDISPRDINSILIVPIIILYGAGSLLLGQLIADRIKNKFPE